MVISSAEVGMDFFFLLVLEVLWEALGAEVGRHGIKGIDPVDAAENIEDVGAEGVEATEDTKDDIQEEGGKGAKVTDVKGPEDGAGTAEGKEYREDLQEEDATKHGEDDCVLNVGGTLQVLM